MKVSYHTALGTNIALAPHVSLHAFRVCTLKAQKTRSMLAPETTSLHSNWKLNCEHINYTCGPVLCNQGLCFLQDPQLSVYAHIVIQCCQLNVYK